MNHYTGIYFILSLFVHFGFAKEDIYIAGFLPEKHEGDLETKNIFDSVNFALKSINNSSHILSEYNLKILWNDTQVSYVKWSASLY